MKHESGDARKRRPIHARWIGVSRAAIVLIATI